MDSVIKFFQELKLAFPLFFEYMVNSFVMAFIALAIVYIVGRMLGLLKQDIPKNIVALIIIIAVGWFMAYMKYEFERPDGTDFFFFVWDIALYVSGAVVVYVLLCFKLYDRIDTLLDKKVGEDKEEKPKRSRKKR